MILLCRHCGKPDDQHHGFEPRHMPVGCVCTPGEWIDPVPAPCSCYVPRQGVASSCARCEHDEACHKVSANQPIADTAM